MKKIISSISLISSLVMSLNASAGLVNLTFHSRANCMGFNETVTWHAGHTYQLWTVSRHRFRGEQLDHQLVANWAQTWRSAAFHTTEGYADWTVEGHHWTRDNEWTMPYQLAEEVVSDCSIYDGWWG